MAKKAAKKKAKKKIAKKPRAVGSDRTDEAPRHPAPIDLDAVLGQARAVGVLRDAASSGRVHHAWIFHGPAGVGKFTTALAFAAMVMDPTTAPDLAGTPKPDPDSPTQQRLRSAAHPDLHVVRKELSAASRDDKVRASKQTTIPKAVVEEFLIEPAARTRTVNGDSLAHKVFVVDEADKLAGAGQNALLKTLEEPPEGTLIILVTTNEERLLPTIRSRCQRVAFTPLPEADMRSWLDSAPTLEGKIEPRERDWLLSFAGGAPGQVIEALDAGFGAWRQALEPLLASADRGGFDLAFGPTLHALVEERAKLVADADARASKDAANRDAARQMFRLLGEWYRQRLRARVDHGDAEAAIAALDAITAAQQRLDRNVQMAFVMDELAGAIARASGAQVQR